MRISELSRHSGVTVATIKYYIREGLLPPGTPTATTQAAYDNRHLRRLHLIRALITTRGLSVNTTKEVLHALADNQNTQTGHTMTIALNAIRHPGQPAPDTTQLAQVDALVQDLGWDIHSTAPTRTTLAETLTALHRLGIPLNHQTLLTYAKLAEQTTATDLEQLGDLNPQEHAEHVLLLTILLEPALIALRRMAHQHHHTRQPRTHNEHPQGNR
ncbi:MerR family transcriptional regulator [Streptomyces sp. NPDC058659]|uniref:MerR family transcriptional regulator n=1 Tax=unclassified Streptomyces TaxID=2593676 RepID=UPI00364E48FE